MKQVQSVAKRTGGTAMTTHLSHHGEFQTFPPRTSVAVARRRMVVYVVGYVLLLAVAVAAGALAGRARWTSPAGVGDAVQEDGLRFVVTDIDAGERQVVVTMTVENVATAAEPVSAGAQELVDAAGRRHAAYGVGATDLAPGARLNQKLVFDVPPGAQPRTLELHASPTSTGVHVDL
jgi:hypothetical protein